jgi:hypothetical protein
VLIDIPPSARETRRWSFYHERESVVGTALMGLPNIELKTPAEEAGVESVHLQDH